METWLDNVQRRRSLVMQLTRVVIGTVETRLDDKVDWKRGMMLPQWRRSLMTQWRRGMIMQWSRDMTMQWKRSIVALQ